MGSDTKIEWAKNTFNPWEGCTRVSPGCAHCYAETRANRYGTVQWGKGQPRRLTSDANWREPVKWNKRAQASGIRERTFCASLADIFDKEAPNGARERLWALIKATPYLDWLLLTKRPENILEMLPEDWGEGYPNVWLGTTFENQEMADKRIPILLKVPAAIHFLSGEPLLGEVDLEMYLGPTPEDEDGAPYPGKIDWVIVGGESGREARPMHIYWARSLRDQCKETKTPFLFKQWGEWTDGQNCPGPGYPSKILWNEELHDCSDDWATELDCGPIHYRVGKKKAGRLLDGEDHNEFPEVPKTNAP